MLIKPIRGEEDYRQALAKIETLMDAESGSEEGERLDLLVTLVEAYERRHYPLAKDGNFDNTWRFTTA